MRWWEWQFAYRLLRSGNGLYQSFLLFSLSGIACVVAGFIATFAILAGFDEAYTRAIARFNGSAVVFKEGGIAPSDPVFLEIEKIAGAQGGASPSNIQTLPFHYGETLLFAGKEMKGVQLKIIDQAHWAEALAHYGPERRLAAASSALGARGVYVGALLDRGLGRPQSIRLLKADVGRYSPGSDHRSFNRNLFVELPVEGSFETGLSEFDGAFILMQEEAYRALGGDTSRFYGIEFYSPRPGFVDSKRLVALRELFSFPYTFMDWRELNGAFFDALKLEKTVFLLVAAAIMGIAILNVMILAAIQMVQKTREWLLLEVLGATLKKRRRLFFKQVFFLSTIGLAAGWILGAGAVLALQSFGSVPLAVELYFLERLPVALSAAPFVWSGVAFLFASALAIQLALTFGQLLQRRYRLH